ncbi:hypothetical protein EYZ11_010753 [Aspergillus tanneri]|uniref:Autophagy-related protein n=1 Tax=Aspergillus tanneri TaxID=1220188 RepID=A0A4S3J4J8_9EURO|nr:uncharacterized protein ATNIH1004_005541 [Aspergillus tanneri]KAA8646866.1 hypothetical protein ATNIH1004_005541 [Aspergillus tanneri]THC89790.1 hypothetical protein EYZ11_010753 [Aspergillus tanneri]
MTRNARFVPVLALFLIFALAAVADAEGCPTGLVYSPFVPYFRYRAGSAQACWGFAICTFNEADEARKQQYGATALVMGLVPLTLRDIAWPERRTVLVSAPLPIIAATAVRALGLEPTVKADVEEERVRQWLSWMRTGWLTNIKAKSSTMRALLVTLSFVALVVFYAALALVEVYSKRSALGCPYPIFGLTWCLVGIVPGAVHSLFASWREEKSARSGRETAVQGADEAWPVQLTWAVYYTAGTLVFTSIMAITVLELFVWVVVMLGVTATSKLLALYICLLLRNPASS